MLEPGDTAPDFTLLDQRGEGFSLSASLAATGARHLVYFYPKASTPGCTTQACGLRDARDEIGDTVVVGISPDKPAALTKFDTKYELGFTLLSDPEHATAEAYDVWAEKSMYGRKYMGIVRSAFLIAPDGSVEQAWYKVSPKDTPENLKRAVNA